jgi:hypothetical protein
MTAGPFPDPHESMSRRVTVRCVLILSCLCHMSLKWPLSFRFPNWNFIGISHLSHESYMPHCVMIFAVDFNVEYQHVTNRARTILCPISYFTVMIQDFSSCCCILHSSCIVTGSVCWRINSFTVVLPMAFIHWEICLTHWSYLFSKRTGELCSY